MLVEGRVYEGKTTWNQTHWRWLGSQRFQFEPTELAFIDLLAAVDGLLARRQVLDERLSRLAKDERLWPSVSRLRAFHGVDVATIAVARELAGFLWATATAP